MTTNSNATQKLNAWRVEKDEIIAETETVKAERIAEAVDRGEEAEIAKEVSRLRVRDAARKRYRAETAPATPLDVAPLYEVLQRPPEPERFAGLLGFDSSMLAVAQHKTGKTTFVLDVCDSLLTGRPFLGRFETVPIESNRKIGFLNFEVSAGLLAGWAADRGLDPHRMIMANLRGVGNPFAHPDRKAELEALLRGHNVESLIVDPFGKAYPGESQNDTGEVARWLAELDIFVRGDVGARDLIMTAHSGWDGERLRGSTALADWADTIVQLTKTDPDPDTGEPSRRYLSAVGRFGAGEIAESELLFDPVTRSLTFSGLGSRKTAADRHRDEALGEAVLKCIWNNGGTIGSKNALEGRVRESGVRARKGEIPAAADRLVRDGKLVAVTGERGSQGYRLVDVSASEKQGENEGPTDG